MSERQRGRRFEPRPRTAPAHRTANDTQNLRNELLRILRRTELVAASGRQDFSEGNPTYDVASMVIIRLASLLERPEFSEFTDALTTEEMRAIRTTRNIAAHGGYDGMNDDLFWAAVTDRVPAIVRRILDGELP